MKYVKGHAYRERGDAENVHRLTDINLLTRRAMCSRCGEVTVKKNGVNGISCTGTITMQHYLIQDDAGVYWCSACGRDVEGKQLSDRVRCIVAYNASRTRDRIVKRKLTPEERSNRERSNYLRRTYGITADEFDAILEAQGGGCAICKSEGSPKRSLCVDHCHTSGKMRRILCNPCNTTLGIVNEDTNVLRAMIAYLEEFRPEGGPVSG